MESRPPSHFPPPPPLPAKVRIFQRVPPAAFPVILGLLGLGLAWRAGHWVFGLPAGPVELLLGAVSLLFLFALAAYAAKITLRPAVVAEDARTLPGRAGLAALTMSIMLLAAILVPYTPGLAGVILYSGFALHVALALHILIRLIRAPAEVGPATPNLYMVFVGIVVSPACAIPLRHDILALGVLLYCTVVTLFLCALTLPALVRKRDAAPLRPLHAIHLAPTGMITAGAALIGLDWLAIAMLIWSSLLFLLLAARLRWMVEAGFSGFWGAYTFPLAAYAGAWVAVHDSFAWDAARVAGGLAMVLATLAIPPIAFRILRLWADGSLAAKTNAAIA